MKHLRTLWGAIVALLALAALLAPVPAFADDPVILQDSYTVAKLPTCSTAAKLRIAMVTDGNATSDCTTGGGSSSVACACNGTTWVSLATLLDYTGTLVAASTLHIDVGGSTDEINVASGETSIGGAFIVPVAAAPPVACASGKKGSIYLDSDINKICVCNGTNYVLANDDTTTTGCS